MKTLRLVLGDQISRSVSSLSDIDRGNDIVLMVEVHDETTYVRHHKQKIVLVLSAMRHFAETLRAEGVEVNYVRLDEEGNTGSFTGELARAILNYPVDQVVVTEPGKWRVWAMMQTWESSFKIPVQIREDTRFLCPRTEFADWAKGRKSFRMEHFYHFMRRKTDWLMSGDQPVDGRWNYDAENRKTLPKNLAIPARPPVAPDPMTREVMKLVEERFAGHFGAMEPFEWAVTRPAALQALKVFIKDCLPRFGAYQDAMKTGENKLFHSLLSPYINIGLLDAREVCEAALDAYRQKEAPISAVEGFIRQILGWREYVRGIYWLKMPDYAQTNFLNASRSLPDFYWSGETSMKCLRESIEDTRQNAYAHHIQRLMITGNFALLAGLAPDQVEAWYLSVYADAFEWVELPNTHGMALYADGGLLGSKPYAASGAYIHRMSDYCGGCRYDPGKKLGSHACPFNYLYWYFLIAHETRLKSNPRMAMPYRTLNRMTHDHIEEIRQQAEEFLANLKPGAHDGVNMPE